MSWSVIWRVGVIVILFLATLGLISLGVGAVIYSFAWKVHRLSFAQAWTGGAVFLVFFYLALAIFFIRRSKRREETDYEAQF